MSAELRHHIGGVWVHDDGDRLDVVDPHTGDVVAVAPAGSRAVVERAVDGAARAQPEWAALPLESRMAVVTAWADAVEGGLDELAERQCREMGQPIELGKMILSAGVAELRASVQDAKTYAFRREVPHGDAGRTTIVRHPLGVAAVIAPWNFPLTTVLAAIGPLVLSGNTVVVKPSELSPLSATRLFEVLDIPDGVLNLVLGDGRAGRPLTEHPRVGLVRFTGSVPTGKGVAHASAELLRRSVLELGGKDPVIVDAGVDPVATAQAVAFGSFMNTGQICTSMERIYVHRDVAEPFVEALTAAAAGHSFSGPDGAGPLGRLGPMVSARQRDIVHAQVEDAVRRGASVRAGGLVPECPGFYYPATVLTDVVDDMEIMREETFGPVAPVCVVASFDEALTRASDSRFALAATIYTEDPEHVRRAEAIPAGLLWVNQWQGGGPGRIYEPARQSGMGATGSFASFDAATRPSSVFVAGG